VEVQQGKKSDVALLIKFGNKSKPEGKENNAPNEYMSLKLKPQPLKRKHRIKASIYSTAQGLTEEQNGFGESNHRTKLLAENTVVSTLTQTVFFRIFTSEDKTHKCGGTGKIASRTWRAQALLGNTGKSQDR